MDLSKNTNRPTNNSDHRSQITDYYLIRYAEIALKGRNRRWFEQQLINNIKHRLQITDYPKGVPITAGNLWDRSQITIHHLHSQLLLEITSHNQNKVRNCGVYPGLPGQPILITHITNTLSKTFGIAWFAPVTPSSLDLHNLTQQTISLARSQIIPKGSRAKRFGTDYRLPFTFAVRVTRHDKSYPLTSKELETHLGSAILKTVNSERLTVNLSHPDLTLYIEILKDRALLYTEKIPGPGGLPVGTAGKALCLLSGGFDSVAAAYLMAKRGLQVDFLHFHIFDNPEQLKQTKIWTIAQFLSPIVHAKTLYTVACSPFQSKLKQLDKKYRSQKLILSRRFMIRTALQLAYQHGYQAIITGDSLGQVASQTLSNLSAVDDVLPENKVRNLISVYRNERYATYFRENNDPQPASNQTSKSTLTTNSPNNSNQITDYRLPIPLFRPLIGMDKVDIIDLVKQIGLYDEVIKPYQDCCSLAATHPATHTHFDTIHQLENQLSLPSFHPKICHLNLN